MKMKKIILLITVIAVICSMAISAGAITDSASHDIVDQATNVRVARVIYQLEYNSSLNCVRATQWVSYETSLLQANQRNFFGEILLTVHVANGSDESFVELGYLTTNTNLAKQEIVVSGNDIASGTTITGAHADYSTNFLNGNSAYTFVQDELIV